MAPPTTVLTDQSLRIYEHDQHLVILSVSEGGLRIGENTEYPTFEHTDYTNGVYLFAETVAATSSVAAPHGLTVATWNLVGPSTPGSVVHLDASGVPGSAGTTESPDGGSGDDGGTVGLYVQNLSDTAARVFTPLARGGDGGETHTAGKKGGNGGNGGSIITVLQPTYLQASALVQEYIKRPEFDASQYQNSVSDSDTLYEGAQALIDMAQGLSATQDTITNIFGPLSTVVDKITKGEKCTVADLLRAAGIASSMIYLVIMQQGNLAAPDNDQVRGGYPGTGKGVEADPGEAGKDGEFDPTFVDSTAARLAQAQLAFAHPEQCAMLLDRANTFFYLNSPVLRSHARGLYRRLIQRLSFLPLQSSDPLYQVYQNSIVMPSTSLDDLKRILDSANGQLVKLNSGKTDYNGYTPRWVPRASYDFYKNVLDDALEDLQSFETAYIQYHTALAKQEDLNDEVKLAYSNTSRMVSRLNEDIEDIWSTLQDLNRKISAKAAIVLKAQKELKAAYEAEKARIEGAFGLGIPQIINAFTSIAMAPHKAMIGAEVTNLVYQGFNSVPTTDGGTVTKEYLASEIKQSEATISNIKLELKEKLDGTYELDDPFGKRLIVEEERMLAQLDKFSEKALGGVKDADTRKDLKTKFDAYIKAVTDRNDSIFQYNVNVGLLVKKTEDKKKYEHEEKKLENRQITNTDPDLPAITAYIDGIYQASRTRVMKLLNILLRSLYFRMLRSHDVLAFAFDNSGDLSVDSVPLSLTSTVLRAARGKIQQQFSDEVEEWGSEPTPFPSNFDTDEGKRYHLDRFSREQLISGHSVTLKIPPVLQYTKDAGDFKDCCNVRVYRVRFGFPGLKTASGIQDEVRVHITLTHGGNETIVNRSNEGIHFDHNPVSAPYSFRMRGDKVTSVMDNGNIGEADINNTATSYAAPGPFAEWTVDLDGTEFEKLDFSGVTEAFFDFCGTNYSYIKL
ncbi:hypothetical protein F5I97DRAFT_2076544 [Phlebopus sp. FC_14]|nr:hypothetical protein F5I97DRAFT_2076544 [Phlebopus sp. FC_14]